MHQQRKRFLIKSNYFYIRACWLSRLNPCGWLALNLFPVNIAQYFALNQDISRLIAFHLMQHITYIEISDSMHNKFPIFYYIVKHFAMNILVYRARVSCNFIRHQGPSGMETSLYFINYLQSGPLNTEVMSIKYHSTQLKFN